MEAPLSYLFALIKFELYVEKWKQFSKLEKHFDKTVYSFDSEACISTPGFSLSNDF